MTTHRVVVMRHAKSSWKDNLPDLERPLSGRGRRDGLAAGQLLVRAGIRPDVVFCSPALRTRQTWERLTAAGAEVGELQFIPELYEADGQLLLHLVRRQPEEFATVMLVGHWPAVQELVGLLARREASEPWRAISLKFPTSGVAIIDLPGPWAEAAGSGYLQSFHVPRGTR